MANKLPIETIVDEILPKLPAKSLLRFKCVSKSFKTLISSPNFIDRHLSHSLSTTTNRLVIGFSCSGLYSYDLDSPQLPPSPLLLPDNFTPVPGNCVGGSCNGLLTIIGDDQRINGRCLLLINPITRFYRILSPKSDFGYGFGFDPVTSEYKLIRIDVAGFMIYSLINGSSRLIASPDDEITNGLIEDVFARGIFAVVVNQCLCHWLVWCAARNKHEIVCLDLSTEKWNIDFPLPNYDYLWSLSSDPTSLHFADHLLETCRSTKYDVINLAVFEGCLSLSTHNLEFHGNFDVWVMKVYGVAQSWVKLFSVSDPWSVPLCYSSRTTSRVLVRKLIGGIKPRIIWYDVRDQHLHSGAHGFDCLYDACVFTGSLVTAPHGQKIRRNE